jgi:hypothetical protein
MTTIDCLKKDIDKWQKSHGHILGNLSLVTFELFVDVIDCWVTQCERCKRKIYIYGSGSISIDYPSLIGTTLWVKSRDPKFFCSRLQNLL